MSVAPKLIQACHHFTFLSVMTVCIGLVLVRGNDSFFPLNTLKTVMQDEAIEPF